MPADATTVSLRDGHDRGNRYARRREHHRSNRSLRKGESSSDSPEGAAVAAPAWLRWALFTLLPLALIAGAYWYVAGGQVMSTDDAYIEADKVGIATDVPASSRRSTSPRTSTSRLARSYTASILGSSSSPSTAPEPSSDRLG